jgi:NADPH-dependent 2,4-dienoyl-CoA reductase/sulfur reductase-like enzyme
VSAVTVLNRVVIVGASLAGLRAAETLRSGGFGGDVVMIGGEPHPPYDRPPLSKKVLQGEWEFDRIMLRSPDQLAALELTERFGEQATALDLDVREVRLVSGEAVGYDALVIATGSRPRALPGQPASAWLLRSIDDSLGLRDLFAAGSRRVVIVGAGFIGLEVASSARTTGNDVTVLEALPAPLTRVFGDVVGPAIATVHADAGVDLRCGVTVAAITDDGVRLGDGSIVPADVVVVGIGAEPVVDWLAGSGLTLEGGVVVESSLRAGRPMVYAAGDVARWPNDLFDGEVMRLEHWTNAADQGAHAARNLLAEAAGEPLVPYEPVPFVWSDQYHHRIQYVGHAGPSDHCEVAVGSIDERSFVALYERGGRLRAAAGLNQPRLVMPYRKLIAARGTFAEALDLAATQRAKLAGG